MSGNESGAFAIPTLPLNPIQPGTILLLTGPRRLTTPISRKLVLEGREANEAAIAVSTNETGRNFLRFCRGQYPDMALDDVGFVDVTGRGDIDVETKMRMRTVSSSGDLTGISIALSILHSEFSAMDIDVVRSSFTSLSILLLYTNPKTITRFVHTVGGRVAATGGLGVFVLDPTMHDKSVVHTLEHICDARVRATVKDGETKMRVDGLPNQPGDWIATDSR